MVQLLRAHDAWLAFQEGMSHGRLRQFLQGFSDDSRVVFIIVMLTGTKCRSSPGP